MNFFHQSLSFISFISMTLLMFIFGISTIPAMFGLGFLTTLASATTFRNMMMSLSSIAVILYGVFTIYNGYDYITNPTKTLRDCHSGK